MLLVYCVINPIRTISHINKNLTDQYQNLPKDPSDGPVLEPSCLLSVGEGNVNYNSHTRWSRVNVKTTHYDREFKQRVVLFAERYSNREAEKKYGISESNVRRWRKLRNEIFTTPSVCCKTRKGKKRPYQKKKKLPLGFESLLFGDLGENFRSIGSFLVTLVILNLTQVAGM